MIDLEQFCGKDSRTWMHKPFRLDGWLHATNGHLVVAVVDDGREAADLGDDKYTGSVRKVVRYSGTAWFRCGQIPLPEMTACRACGGSGQSKICDACDGDGYRECDMGHEHECDECHGTGRWRVVGDATKCGKCINGQRPVDPCPGVTIAGHVFNPIYVARVLGIGTAVCSVHQMENGYALCVRGDGWKATIASMRPGNVANPTVEIEPTDAPSEAA